MTTQRVGEHKILLEAGGLLVPAGSTIAYLYDGPEERARFGRFIASGLAEGQKCVIVTDSEGRQVFLDALSSAGVNTDDRIAEGSLLIIANLPGARTGDLTFARIFEDLKSYPGTIRLINDTSWMSERGWRDRDFLRLEGETHLLTEQGHATIICQYDVGAEWRWRLNWVFSSHEFTIVSPRVERNPDGRPGSRIVFDSMTEHLLALTRLQDASLSLTASLELDQVIDAILDAVITICHADRAAISCLDETGDMKLLRHRGLSDAYVTERRLTTADPSVSQLIASREPLIIEDIDRLEGVSANYEAWRREGIRSIVSLPLVSEGEVFGMIGAGSSHPRRYTRTETDAMAILAAQASAAVVNSRLFEELREANRAKDEFLAILSHELRTPLTPILGWMHMLRRFAGSDPALAQGLETVERNAEQLLSLINDLLDLSRAVNGKIELARELSDISALASSVLHQVGQLAAAKRIRLEKNLPDTLMADIDPIRIHQVVANLLNNAVKFTPEGGRVTLSLATANDGGVVIQVEDTGIGIEPQFLPHVFERFTQAHVGMNRGYGGLGLGLAITRAMVERHGGQITAESGGAGKGSRFTVRLPGASKIAALDNGGMTDFATEQSAIEQLGFRVLVVEDSRDTLDMIELWLTTFGCEVQVAASAPAALKLAAEDPPDLIISDIGLPDLDGYQLIRKVRQMPGLRSIPAIALTGFARPEDRELALAAGYDAHLSKPAEMRRLIRLMKRLMNTNSSNADQTLRTTDSSSSSSRS